MEILDMTGQPCPIPVVRAKKALAAPGADGVVVLVDNIVAVQNLEKMAHGLGYGFSFRETGEKQFQATLTKTGGEPAAGSEHSAPVCEAMPAPGTLEGATVLITGKTLGRGDDELGAILMKGFLFSLTEIEPAPQCVIFLNSAAHLTTEGANTVPDLKTLEEKGVEILTCGTCANFFGLTDKLAVGAITDMMGIASRITSALRLVSL